MAQTPVVPARRLRDTRIRRTAASHWRRAVLVAGAAAVSMAVLAACSGPSDGSSSAGEGAVGANVPETGPSGAGHAKPAYRTIGPVGSEPGKLIIKPASGSTNMSPTWSTTDACPSGYQTSAQLYAAVFGSADLFQWISGTINPGNSPIPEGQHLQLNSSVAAIQQVSKTPNGQTDKWVVRCSTLNSGFGDRQYVQSVLVHYSADGKSYTTSSS